MNKQNGFAHIIFIVLISLLAVAAVGYIKLAPWHITQPLLDIPIPPPPDTDPTAESGMCTDDLKQCPDGSYVGRAGKNCEFAACPAIKPPCKKDSDCPSARYTCEAIIGVGTACPSDDPSCTPTYTIEEGVCKLKKGERCQANSDCSGGLLCYRNTCTSPMGDQCSGPRDTSCPSGYECIQGCGPPVPLPNEDEPPPPYYCTLKGYPRTCPICLAADTLIDTPSGRVAVQNLKEGMAVWTTDTQGTRVPAIIVKVIETPVPPTHQVVHVVLDDGRHVFVSPGHPTADGRTVGNLTAGEQYNNARIVSVERVPYTGGSTYDILPSGQTGFYWANGILLGSTLR